MVITSTTSYGGHSPPYEEIATNQESVGWAVPTIDAIGIHWPRLVYPKNLFIDNSYQ